MAGRDGGTYFEMKRLPIFAFTGSAHAFEGLCFGSSICSGSGNVESSLLSSELLDFAGEESGKFLRSSLIIGAETVRCKTICLDPVASPETDVSFPMLLFRDRGPVKFRRPTSSSSSVTSSVSTTVSNGADARVSSALLRGRIAASFTFNRCSLTWTSSGLQSSSISYKSNSSSKPRTTPIPYGVFTFSPSFQRRSALIKVTGSISFDFKHRLADQTDWFISPRLSDFCFSDCHCFAGIE
mmetsp:Transcript_104428/g.156406  ORF Transcript_104428/g.156406 Transcript_104428/m.156406 type:complete len:240 (-) Transcript_104428:544-1263(-)